MLKENGSAPEPEAIEEAPVDNQPTDEKNEDDGGQPSSEEQLDAGNTGEDDSPDNPGEGEDLDREPESRPVQTVPVNKFNEMRKAERAARERAEKAEQEIEKLKNNPPQTQQKPTQEGSEEEIQKVADEHGITFEAAQALVNIASKQVESRLAPYKEHFETQEIESQKQQVATAFDSKVTERIQKDFPGATPEFINEVKESIMGLAFTKRYNTYSVEDIYEVTKSGYVFQNKNSAEPSGGGVRDIVDYDSVTDADVEKMSPAEYRKYSDYMASKERKWDSMDDK